MPSTDIERVWSRLWTARFNPTQPRLRFELGGNSFDNITQPIGRFLQAHRRAAAIADMLFQTDCHGIVAWDGRPPCSTGLPEDVQDGFGAIGATGFRAPLLSEWMANLYPDPEDDDDVWVLRSYDLATSTSDRDVLLWHSIAGEMPIYPSAPVHTFLIDVRASLLMHVYDDRGVDVIADDPDSLRALYTHCDAWLLDHDRERMNMLFDRSLS